MAENDANPPTPDTYVPGAKPQMNGNHASILDSRFRPNTDGALHGLDAWLRRVAAQREHNGD